MESRQYNSLLPLASLLVCSAMGLSQQPITQASPEQGFQAAVAAYESHDYRKAAGLLHLLLPQAAHSYEVHELLGLTYAAQGDEADALEELQTAVDLNLDSAAARTNLATALVHARKPKDAEAQYARALTLDPHDYTANHNLAEMRLAANQVARALPLLEEAHRLRPDAMDTTYDLGLAYLLAGNLAAAREQAAALAERQQTSEVHTLLGKINEQDGKYLEAEQEFAAAAHQDPSEENLFAWASELLLHRTYEPAITIFQRATERYPKSPRLWIGLGMALYSRSEYDKSIQSLLTAADLDPQDARCYVFLSKAYLSSPHQADGVIERFRRYAELEPNNAKALEYYAVSLWKGRRIEDPHVDYAAVEALLRRSVALDGSIADAHLQLGILLSEQHRAAEALPEYQRALQLNPDLPDAHYRLGQYYVHAGDKTKAQAEFDQYQRLQAQHQAEVDKERAAVQQFVVSTSQAMQPGAEIKTQ